MPRPNYDVTVHKSFHEWQVRIIQAIIADIAQKESLDAVDVKAIEGLALLCEFTQNLSQANPEQPGEVHRKIAQYLKLL